MILFKECDLYSPAYLGKKDVLISGKKIVAIQNSIDLPPSSLTSLGISIIPAHGLRMIPGLIDGHVHIAGAGGEGGPSSRTPEMPLSKMLDGGITTVIGCLGTDGFTRNIESVLMKTKKLRDEGVSAWMFTGSYQVPPPTILGDVGKDIAMFDEIIGVGEIAISDHRSSNPTLDQLIHLIQHARVGGLIGGKSGIVIFHMGDAPNPFHLLYQVVQHSQLPFSQFLPTHCNRNHHIFQDAKKFGKKGYIDITASSYPFFPQYEIKPAHAIAELLNANVPLEHITMSSDACGSLPDFDEKGNLIQLVSGNPKSIFTELIDMVETEHLPLEIALKVVTTNVAHLLKLPGKGQITINYDADLVLLDKDYHICHLIANGTPMISHGQLIKKGNYET